MVRLECVELQRARRTIEVCFSWEGEDVVLVSATRECYLRQRAGLCSGVLVLQQ